MNIADWVIVIILAVSTLISLKRGFAKEALSLITWLVAFLVASTSSDLLLPFVSRYLQQPSLQQIAAFSITFIVVLLLGALVNYLLGRLIKTTGLSGTDRLLGMLFGCFRGILVLMIFVIYAPLAVPVNQDAWWQQSLLIPYFLSFEQHFHELKAAVFSLF